MYLVQIKTAGSWVTVARFASLAAAEADAADDFARGHAARVVDGGGSVLRLFAAAE